LENKTEEEIELTYLAKFLPKDLANFPHKEMIDLYIPAAFDHPTIRIRKNGDKYVITKKEPLVDDPSHMLEQTIKITETEFVEFLNFPAKKVEKHRYEYPYQGLTAEFDVFQGDLAGLVLIDFEFKTREDQAKFVMPDFCLVEVTQEKFTAGGMLCGKKYADIQDKLGEYHYQKISTI